MQLQLPRAHRLARINYPTRSASFAFSFLVVMAVLAERGFSAGTLILGIVTLLVYPQLAYLHARLAVNSKRAEFRNLILDSILMGVWVAQLHFALWPFCGALVGVSMNNAVCGGLGRLLSGLLGFAAAALIWAVALGVPIEASTGPTVSMLCLFGIVGYVCWLAVSSHDQNSRLFRTQKALGTSEKQFRFIAEHAGDLVSVLSPEHRFRYASPSHEKYFESAKFAEGADWLDLVHPEDRGRARVFFHLLGISSHSERAQLRLMPSSGTASSMVECEGNPVREEDGKLQMIVLLCRELIVSEAPAVASPQGVAEVGKATNS